MTAAENALAAKLLDRADAVAISNPEKLVPIMQAYNLLMQAAAARASIPEGK